MHALRHKDRNRKLILEREKYFQSPFPKENQGNQTITARFINKNTTSTKKHTINTHTHTPIQKQRQRQRRKKKKKKQSKKTQETKKTHKPIRQTRKPTHTHFSIDQENPKTNMDNTERVSERKKQRVLLIYRGSDGGS
jgi:hypothetical protein